MTSGDCGLLSFPSILGVGEISTSVPDATCEDIEADSIPVSVSEVDSMAVGRTLVVGFTSMLRRLLVLVPESVARDVI